MTSSWSPTARISRTDDRGGAEGLPALIIRGGAEGLHAFNSCCAEELCRLEQRLHLGRRLLLRRVEGLLVAVDPDHGDLGLQARLDVVVVARRDVHPALLGADPPLGLLE